MKKFLVLLLLFSLTKAVSQKNPKSLTRLSSFLSKTYYNFNFGLISYPYSDSNLKPGFISENVTKNRFSGRILLGYKIKNDLAIQFGVMRPASWYSFNNINNIGYNRSVWFNLWSLSLKKSFQLNEKLSLYSEFGVGNVSRVGFEINNEVIYKDAHYASIVTGLGLSYQLNNNWDALLNATYVPKSTKHNQPQTLQTSIGLQYNLKDKSKKLTDRYDKESRYFFPRETLQLGFGSSKFGFFANEFFSMSAKIGGTEGIGLPVFWLGEVKAKSAFMLTYSRTAYHTEKLFSLEWGVSISQFNTLNNTSVFALSIFPMMRFFIYRASKFDSYINYSIIGPTFLTQSNIDGYNTGPKITYQDFMGFGVYFGKQRKYNFELRIMHYSNGNIFPENDGVDVPVMFTFGKSF